MKNRRNIAVGIYEQLIPVLGGPISKVKQNHWLHKHTQFCTLNIKHAIPSLGELLSSKTTEK